MSNFQKISPASLANDVKLLTTDTYQLRSTAIPEKLFCLVEDIKKLDLSGTITGEDMPPITPGDHLAEFIEDSKITAYQLAKGISVSQTRISEILKGRRAITAETALRFGRYFGNSAQFWTNLQTHYDIAMALNNLDGKLDQEVTPLAANK